MRLTHSGLELLLGSSIAEVKFRRRHDKPGWSDMRRMLCTNSVLLLNSVPGRLALNFRPPKGVGKKYNTREKGLVIAWDLLWAQYRTISLDVYDIVAVIPVKTPQDIEEFWVYFNESLYPMSSRDKMSFMNV